MADPKATLTFKLNTPSNQRWSGAFPIEIRDEKLVLRARGASDDKLEVPPGRYFVTALLPNGDQSTVDDVVVLNAGDSRQLEISVSDLSFPPTLETTSTLKESFWEITRPVAQYFFKQSVAVIRGNWLAGRISGAAAQPPPRREPTTRSNLDFTFSTDATWVEIESAGKYNYFAVPVDEGGKTTVEWALDVKSDKFELTFDFHDGELNSFLDFIQNDHAREARSISNTLVTRPDKKQSPLRAALGAYVLIRANQLKELDAWTGSLVGSSPWLPDAVAIRVEYLARNGRHPEALKLLMDIPQAGVPLFRSGIGYLADRAKTYAKVVPQGRSDLSLAGNDQEKLQQIALVFGELASSLDMSLSTSALRHIAQIKSG